MFFGKRSRNAMMSVSMAAQPGFAAAVQLAGAGEGGRPRLMLAQVQPGEAPAQRRLESMARQIHMRKKSVRLLLDRSEYQLLQVEAPVVPVEEMKAAVRWQVKDMLRMPLEQVTLDVAPPPEATAGDRRAMAYVAAASNEIVRERMLGFRIFSSDVDVIDIPEMAQRNIADRLEEPGRATAVLSMNAAGCLLTASREGTLYFTRHFDLSGGLSERTDERRDQFDKLVLDLQRSVDVLEHQFSFLSVSTLWLAPFAHADELLTLLIEHLYLPARRIDLATLFDCRECSLPASPAYQAALFHTLGLALRPMEAGA
jgi:MSHA biogenesis protein MshI